MKHLEYKNFEIKSVNFENDEMIIDAYAASFGNKDAIQETYKPEMGWVFAQDTIKKGAFKKTIEESGDRIAFCLNHDMYDPKGKIQELKEDDVGLFVKVRISDAEPELKTKINEGIYKELSIGFVAINAKWSEQEKNLWLRELTEIKLYEISLVTLARDEYAKILSVKSDEIIDRILKNVKNEEIKFELLRLKTLLNDLPAESEPQEQKKPIELDAFKDILNKFLN